MDRAHPDCELSATDELLLELSGAARELQLPVGLIVTAAIAHLLDQEPAEVAALVDRAEDARTQDRPSARHSPRLLLLTLSARCCRRAQPLPPRVWNVPSGRYHRPVRDAIHSL
jgi:hypothetical protein